MCLSAEERGAELKKCSGAVVDEVLRCLRGAEVEVVQKICRDTELQIWRC